MKTRRYFRLAFLVLATLAAAWVLPSLIHAERYRHKLQANLQQVLGRQVRFGAIYFRMVPRPGFSIDNVTVLEDRAFGSEAFARIDHVDCDLAAGSLLRGRIALSRLHLEGAAINLVRNASGQWNVERMAMAAPAAGRAMPSGVAVDVDGSRLNFKLGTDKKPFTVTGLKGRIDLDRKRSMLTFDLTGSPVRTDLSLPTPGTIQLQGTLSPSSEGALNAVLRTRGALVYDWIPMAVGRNPGIYGLMDLEAHVTGSLAAPEVDAQVRLRQLRRWESLPPAGDLPVSVSLEALVNRQAGEVRMTSLIADVGSSRLTARGKVTVTGQNPELDLVVAATHSQLEDLVAFATRLKGPIASFAPPRHLGLTGKMDALVEINGPWSEPLFSGSISAGKARLEVGGASFPISDALIQCDGREINLLPVKITAGPGIILMADGVLRLREANPPHRVTPRKGAGGRERAREPGYRLTVSAHSVPGHDLVGLARTLGLRVVRELDLQGPVTASVSVTAPAVFEAKPVISGVAELRADTLWLPGLSEPVPIEEAHISLEDDRLLVNPIKASFADSNITARIGHSGPRSEPWTFEAHATAVDLGQALSWFEAFGHQTRVPWFERIPGLSTLAGRRAAGTGLFNALNARGEFTSTALNYGGLSLRNLSARAEISKRDLRVTGASFRISTGKGQAAANFDFTGRSPHLTGAFELQGLRAENWTSHLPAQLGELRGLASLSGHLSSEGSSRAGLESNLLGHAQVRLINLDFGHFDFLRDAAQMAAWGDLTPNRSPITLRSTDLALAIRDGRAELEPVKVDVAGAVVGLSGSCDFAGDAQLESTVDLRHVNRHWQADPDSDSDRTGRFLLSGDLNALRATTEDPSAQARR